jgi:acyl-CoA thioesterase-1
MHKSGKQWRTLAAIGMVLFALTTAQSLLAANHGSSRVKRILVVGDSLSAGLLLKPSEAWPMLIVDKLRDAGLSFEVTNASRSGDTTSGGLARLPAQLKRPIDIFVVELGINDAWRGIPIEQIQHNLQEIIDRVRAKNRGVRIVIAGMQLPDSGADGYVHDFGRIFTDLAAKNHAALVPYLLEGVFGNPALNLYDRIHPNAAGHKILAENVWAVLEPIAREVAAQPVIRKTSNAQR